jgi:hypothetical protein
LFEVVCAARASLNDLHFAAYHEAVTRKFFENTRDSGNGKPTLVSTRLPKNFRRNHPMVSASMLVGWHRCLFIARQRFS